MFGNLKKVPIDPIFGVVKKFNADESSIKVNLSIGVYTNEGGKPFVFD